MRLTTEQAAEMLATVKLMHRRRLDASIQALREAETLWRQQGHGTSAASIYLSADGREAVERLALRPGGCLGWTVTGIGLGYLVFDGQDFVKDQWIGYDLVLVGQGCASFRVVANDARKVWVKPDPALGPRSVVHVGSTFVPRWCATELSELTDEELRLLRASKLALLEHEAAARLIDLGFVSWAEKMLAAQPARLAALKEWFAAFKVAR